MTLNKFTSSVKQASILSTNSTLLVSPPYDNCTELAMKKIITVKFRSYLRSLADVKSNMPYSSVVPNQWQSLTSDFMTVGDHRIRAGSCRPHAIVGIKLIYFTLIRLSIGQVYFSFIDPGENHKNPLAL